MAAVTILFNFYAEYIMRNAGLEEAQAGIKIAGRNINKQIGGTQKKKDILNFKWKTMSVYLKLSMSQCMFLFLDNMKLISSI